MEAMGRDGDRGPSLPWSYSYRRHEETESSCYTISSSSRSGTIVSSTAYTCSSSCLSSGISMDAALQLDLELELRLGTPNEKDSEFAQPIKKMMHMENLVQEFFHGPSSQNRSFFCVGGGGMSALERWFSELGVSWVLQLDVGGASASAWVLGHPPTDERWIWVRALTQIMETIRLTTTLFPHLPHGFVGMPGISEEEEEVQSGKQAATSLNPALQFAMFFQIAMAKMLVFVDVMFSKSLSIPRPQDATSSLCSCLHIHSALSEALSGITLQFHSPHSAEVEAIEKEIVSLLSAKQGKVIEAIWSILQEVRTRALKAMEEYSLAGTQTPQESSDIHMTTYLVMNHMDILLHNKSAVDLLASQAASLGKNVPQTGLGEAPKFISLITEMVSYLEKKLITRAQLFLDKGLGLLFLINNSNFIHENFKYTLTYTKVAAEIITRKDKLVVLYIQCYIQVSWAPMLSCLSNHTPLCLGRNYSPLSKFESKFQKVYTTQKLWKVPDPELRKRLRKAVIEKIIPGYTKYIEDNKVTNPKFTPKELEEMLQELFEG